MSEISLYKTCLEKVITLLKIGFWGTCRTRALNPFSDLPSKIVDDLIVLLESDNPLFIVPLPLLTCGSLTRLHLEGFENLVGPDYFLSLIRRDSFKHLRILSWSSGNKNWIPLVEALICSCPNLQEFHSSLFINLSVFQNCKELRVLRMAVQNRILDSSCLMNLSILASFKNLQMVYFGQIMDDDMIVNILKLCPQLISVGCIDSLKALERKCLNMEKDCQIGYTEASDHLKLRKCVWGAKSDELHALANNDVALYKSNFSAKIRIAVSVCPFVEELVICVSHIDSIGSLKKLKQLTRLKISFMECEDNCIAAFLDLLEIIGPNLKHISVNSRDSVPVDVICGFCPMLEILEIVNFATLSESVQPCLNNFMKKLRIMYIDRKALLFLLGTCTDLVELYLCHALCLDDSLLCLILSLHHLERLQICDIASCSLTERGFRMILEKAVSLRRVNFAFFQNDIATVVENIIDELRLNVIYGEMFDMPHVELGSKF